LTGLRPRARAFAAGLLLLAAAGCTTWRGPLGGDSGIRALSPRPDIPPAAHATASEGIMDAFFAANRIELEPQELSDIFPGGGVQEHAENPASLLRAAQRHEYIVAAITADPDNLWDALGRNRPLLLYLPSDRPDEPPRLVIPVRWDRRAGLLRLLDGDGSLTDIPEDRFFALREPLRHNALCLVRPSEVHTLPLSARDRRLLLADYRLARGDYRRAEALYRDLPPPTGETAGADLRSLSGQAASLVRLGMPAKAIPLYEQALAADPGNPSLLNNLAYAKMLDGNDLPEALHLARRALEAAPANPVFLETAGSLELRLGNPEAAARTLERAWTRSSRQPPGVQIAIQDQLARAWLAAGRRDLAWQVAEHRYRTFPDHAMPSDLAEAFPSLRRHRAPHPAP
jgi:tetratricopeptide (TPR) repeat protein